MVLSHHLELTSGPINSKVRGRRWNGARTAGEIDVFQGVSERLCPYIVYSSQPDLDHSLSTVYNSTAWAMRHGTPSMVMAARL